MTNMLIVPFMTTPYSLHTLSELKGVLFNSIDLKDSRYIQSRLPLLDNFDVKDYDFHSQVDYY